MTALILWIMRFIIAYWVIRIILLMLRGGVKKRPRTPEEKKESVRRFDSSGKNISDADFKDMG
jgi:hypothetical protein